MTAAILIAAVCVWFMFPGGGAKPVPNVAGKPCLPPGVLGALERASTAKRSPGNLSLYFDVSGGMAGYAKQTPNVFGNLVKLSSDFTQNSLYPEDKPGKVRFHGFGVYRFDSASPQAPPAIADPEALARPATYHEADTHIADALQWIAHEQDRPGPDGPPLSVLVTDLMLDDPGAVDAFEASVGGVLRNLMIKKGVAVGILAVRVPFDGKVYIGRESFVASAPDRPLVMILIGSPYQVRAYYDYLGTSELAPFATRTPVSEKQFALFGLEAGSIAAEAASIGGMRSGFVSRQRPDNVPGADQLRTFSYDAQQADLAGKGRLHVTLKADADVRDFEVIGNQPLSQGLIWQLDEKAVAGGGCDVARIWARRGSLPVSGWQRNGQQIEYSLGPREMKQAGLDAHGTYLVQILAGQRGLVADHPAVEWMRQWSQSAEEMRARLARTSGAHQLGVTGLLPLRNLLMAELVMPGRQEIERSASQFLVVSE